jgi:tape measure domain-containing protein
MAKDLERLLVRLEVSQRKFERQLQTASRTADKRANAIERRFKKMNSSVSKGFSKIGSSARSSFSTVSRFAALAAASLGTREIIRYADAWTRVENQIKAAEKISGTQARTTEELVDLSNRSRSAIEETATLYARLLRVSSDVGASEMEVAQATETVAKAFKAGGAAASEQAAGVLQLSQALGSGFLQGDELRSLRENAPLISKAIATEFETTIGGLKKLGAEGELTSDKVFKAILNAQGEIQKAFAVTTPTIADGFTAFRNGMIELVAAFSQGAGMSDSLSTNLADLGAWLARNADKAEQFGARVVEALTIVQEVAGNFQGAFDVAASAIKKVPEAVADATTFIIDAIQNIIATAAGVGGGIAAAMLAAVDAVSGGAVGIVNAAIGAIDSILQKITDGINKVIENINGAIQTANGLGGNFGFLDPILRSPIEPIEAPAPRGGGVEATFTGTRDKVRATLEAVETRKRRQVQGKLRRIQRAGEKNFERGDPRGDQIRPDTPTASTEETKPTKPTPTKPSRGGGRGKGSSSEQFFATIEREKQALEDKIALLGLTETEMQKLETTQTLLAEAKKRGLDLDARSAATGKTLREEIDSQATAIANLADSYRHAKERADFFDDANQSLKEGFLDAIVEGESLSGVLEGLAKKLARAALEAALFNEGPFAQGGSGKGALGAIFEGIFGGFRASGGPVASGKSYVVGERGPELFSPPTSGTIIPNHALGASTARTQVEIFVNDDGKLGAIARQEGAAAGAQMGVQVMQRSGPNMVKSTIGKGGADSAMGLRFGQKARSHG